MKKKYYFSFKTLSELRCQTHSQENLGFQEDLKQDYIIFQIRQLNLNYAISSAYFPISSSVTGYFQIFSLQMTLVFSWMAVNVTFPLFMKHRKMKVFNSYFQERKKCHFLLLFTILLMMQTLYPCMFLSFSSICYHLLTLWYDIFTLRGKYLVSSRVQHALSLPDAYFKII